jgi:hypothetical protein
MAKRGEHPFERTGLWKKSFVGKRNADDSEAMGLLRISLLDSRRRAEILVSLISKDIPFITVHDISHLDALWETASLIAGKNYQLNPAEAFVFGCAILLHDAAMSLAAYPDGMTTISKTPQWKDVVAELLFAQSGESPSEEVIANPSPEIAKQALPEVLRELHAIGAENLAQQAWQVSNGDPEFLIQNSDLRASYGSIIGKIAASHWWSAFELENLPRRVNAAPGVPSAWHLNPIKIACLLRVSDAAHIDHRRAPRFLRALVNPQGVAEDHWKFQSKLGKPSIENGFLVYTGEPFTVADSEAWWLCHEMLKGIDKELRDVRSILEAQHLPEFEAAGVYGINSPATIAKLIITDGWRPIDTEVRVSDVPALVALLGGKHLYGANPAAALRELIQNSADSIRARHLVAENESLQFKIRIGLRSVSSDEYWLDVEDNGIGMSPAVLTGALLDFGRSFWKSSDMRREFPGLFAKGMRATGRYGIGFFSVFMLGDEVTVTSRRYDAAASETHTLDFRRGLSIRPILREPKANEALSQSGTCVSIRLREKPKDGILRDRSNNSRSLGSIVARICPAVDVLLATEDLGNIEETPVLANDWLEVDGKQLLERVLPDRTHVSIEHFADSVRILRDLQTAKIYGRACILPMKQNYMTSGVLTVGGFRAMDVSGIGGILIGEPQTASRDLAIPTVPANLLRKWSSEQAELISESALAPNLQLKAASLVMTFGGAVSKLPIAIQDDEYLSRSELEARFRDMDKVTVYEEEAVSHTDDDEVTLRRFEKDFTISPELFLVPTPIVNILKIGEIEWPQSISGLYSGKIAESCLDIFISALEKSWEGVPDRDHDEVSVGRVDGVDIIRSVTIYTRPEIFEDEE